MKMKKAVQLMMKMTKAAMGMTMMKMVKGMKGQVPLISAKQ
jgi:hypothetical protein